MKKPHTAIEALATAALSIPTVYAATAEVPAPPPQTEMRVQYAFYQDYQAGGESRMIVRKPSAWIRSAIDSTTELHGSFVMDATSGASPLYLDALSGASGVGIKDQRYATNLRLTKTLGSAKATVGTMLSDEDDYTSRGLFVEGRWSDPKALTELLIGASGYSDSISASNAPLFSDSRKTGVMMVGLTQVINQLSVLQSNLSYTIADGYTSDPYKPFDHRPRNRESYSWLTRYNVFIPSLDASLHADYRLYGDTWKLLSHLVEISLYQPVTEKLTIVPLIRYYTQSDAKFFQNTYPPDNSGFYSADQRLSAFGSVSYGIRLIAALSQMVNVTAGVEQVQQDGYMRPGGGTSGIKKFGGDLYTIGAHIRF